jgi:3D (Asp-Asp-Asp) domain-containing protein
MKKIKAIPVVVLAVIATILFPLGMISFIAAESSLTTVTLFDDGEATEFITGASTVEGFFSESNVAFNANDFISHSLEALLWDGMVITIEREISFYIQTDSGELIERTARPGITIASVITQIQQEIDTALVYRGDASATIKNGDIFSFDTWRSRNEIEFLALPYETVRNRTNAVSRGREHLRVEGEDGLKSVTTAIVYVGGHEDSREVIGTEVITEPVDAVLDVGTGWLGSLTNTNAPDFHYYRRVRMEATAYTAGYGCTGKHPDDPWYGITASGRRVQHGIVAVDRSVIPLGTQLYVDGYGFAIAADVGGAIRGNKIDLFMYEIEDALRFGRRHIDVWILDEI